uniref:exodeoxyribonuclease III n=1 Tax=Salvator merianae TaxID=96440 RepID=A0A8D0BTJ7_SALMN
MGKGIYFLQETHQSKIKKILDHPVLQNQYLSPGTSKFRGVALIIHSAISFQVDNFKSDSLGRYIFLNGKIDSNKYTLASVYAPNSGQKKFIEDTLEELFKFATGNIIVGGDFNLIVNKQIDRTNRKHVKSVDTRETGFPSPHSPRTSQTQESWVHILFLGEHT